MVPSRNLDYIFYSAFDSSKGKNRLHNGQDATNLEITILGKLNISKNSGGSSKFSGGLNVIHTTTQTQTLTLTLLCVRIINVSTSVWRMELSVGPHDHGLDYEQTPFCSKICKRVRYVSILSSEAARVARARVRAKGRDCTGFI